MRIHTFLIIIFLCPALALAKEQWQKFSIGGEGDKQSVKIGDVALTFQTRAVQNADFKEDYLVMTVRTLGKKPRDFWFNSSYGYGEVSIQGKLLLLKYGIGRGTFARTDHMKVLQLESLEELGDVQSSYYFSTDLKRADPDLIEYNLSIGENNGYTKFTFTLSKAQQGIPSEKILLLKNDD